MTTINAYHQTLHFAFAKAATDRAAGTIVASRAAALALGTRPESVSVTHVAGTPPVISTTDATVQQGGALAISLSHRDGRAVAVATRSAALRVGLDLERADGLSAAYARYFLTGAEWHTGGTLSLNQLWALKEAAWKALACDATTPFTALELGFGIHGRLDEIRLRRRCVPAHALIFAPWKHTVCAVVFIAEAA